MLGVYRTSLDQILKKLCYDVSTRADNGVKQHYRRVRVRGYGKGLELGVRVRPEPPRSTNGITLMRYLRSLTRIKHCVDTLRDCSSGSFTMLEPYQAPVLGPIT